jgi:serine/threonine protein kinase
MPATERLPATLGQYRLQDRLGEGGMGVVHLACDPEGRLVALKVLRPWVAEDINARRRLIREVETMRRVRSPYVAEVLDADVTGEYPYIVTRYVSGPTLDDMVRKQGPLSDTGVQRLAIGLAEALKAIHAAGIVHRDLKPGNVMLSDNRPVVIDFGIAQAPESTRLTQTGMVMGTPGYLAPEVIEGKPSTPASDVHAWGATLAYAATGRPPFGSGSFETIFFRVISGRADLAGVPAALVPVIAAALDRDPARRPTATWLSDAAANPAAVSFKPASNGNGNGHSASLDARTLTALDPLERRQSYPASPGASPLKQPSFTPGNAAAPQPRLLPPGPIGRAGIPADPPAGRAQRQPRSQGPANAHWLLGLAFTTAAAALTVVLPVAGLLVSLAVITVLRAADIAQNQVSNRREIRGPRPSDLLLVTILTPLSVLRALLTTVLLAPFALLCGTAAWAVTMVVTRHVSDPHAPAFAAAAVVVCYGVGPGSRRPRRQLRRMMGPLARTRSAATIAALATWAVAAAAVSFAMSQPPYFWPIVAPVLPHTAVVPRLPMLPSLHSLVTSAANWLTGHTRL